MRGSIGLLIAAGLVAGFVASAPTAEAADGTNMLVVPGRPGVPDHVFRPATSPGRWWKASAGLDRPRQRTSHHRAHLPGRATGFRPPPAITLRPARRPRSGRLEVEPPPNRAPPKAAGKLSAPVGASNPPIRRSLCRRPTRPPQVLMDVQAGPGQAPPRPTAAAGRPPRSP